MYTTQLLGTVRTKEDFFAEVAHLNECCKGLWAVCGDFNNTRSQDERRGKMWSHRAMNLFNDLINELALIELPMANQSYTWSNMQRNPILAKLDRFLISTEWEQEFPLSKVKALPRVISDHCPILLSVERTARRKRSFTLRTLGLTIRTS
uniref:Endonuclease/exonuclease/phosphatase domain-containing protein n=1 Tax=Ananas comosus var. bracteatus TaxID=296719 RepID=A0A6V7PRW1_ANACO|nr:unnamed protein product [Ananas comosus var. bracteatus]